MVTGELTLRVAARAELTSEPRLGWRYQITRSKKFTLCMKDYERFGLKIRKNTMNDVERPGGRPVIGPNGSPLTLADLFPAGTSRWVPRRKAEIVVAVEGGMLSFEEACKRYNLGAEELLSWQQAVRKYGLRGLRVSYLQHYRQVSRQPR